MAIRTMLRKLIDNRDLLLYCALFFVLPFSTRVTSWCIWLILASWLLDRSIVQKLKAGFANKWVLLFALPFFLQILTLLYTADVRAGMKSLENKSYLLLFPLVLSAFKYTPGRVRFFQYAFVVIVLFLSLVCVVVGVYNFMHADTMLMDMAGDVYNKVVSPWNFLTNERLVDTISISPIYMSALVGIAILVVIDLLRHSAHRAALVGALVALCLFIILVGARMGIVSLVVVLAIHWWNAAFKVRSRRAFFVALMAGIAIAFSALFWFNPVLQKRFGKDLVNLSYPQSVEGWNSANLRVAVWHCGWEAAKQKPLLGYGLGTEHVVRESCYRGFSFYGQFGTELNSHNQYLEYMLIGGVILLAGFLAGLVAAMRLALHLQSDLLLLFIVFFALNLLTESFLAVQKGLVMYAFFIAFFTFSGQAGEKRE